MLTFDNKKEYGIQGKFLPKHVMPVPFFLVKLPVFTVCSKNTNRKNEYRTIKIDSFNGFENIVIKGESLNFSLDFRVFSCLMKILDENKNVIEKYTISIKFMDFCETLGYNRNSIGDTTKKAIINSLIRLKTQNINFFRKEENIKLSSFINDIEIIEKNIIIEYNKSIEQIYKNDILFFDLKTLNSLKTEGSKCLWIYFESNSKFKKFKRTDILKRMQLKQVQQKEINRYLKKSLDELVKIGYLISFSLTKDYLNIERSEIFNKIGN